jgi:hypothetical protein
MRSHMLELVADLDATTAVAQAPTAFTLDFEEQPIVPGVDDLLGSLEGFELAPPAPFGHEQEPGQAEPELQPELQDDLGLEDEGPEVEGIA